MKPVKKEITIICYSCRPNSGSEWGVGWNYLLMVSTVALKVKLYLRDAERQISLVSLELRKRKIENIEIIPVQDFFLETPISILKGRYQILNYSLWISKTFFLLIKNKDWESSQTLIQPTWVSDWFFSPFFLLPYKHKIIGPIGSQPKNFIRNSFIDQLRFVLKILMRFNPLLFLSALISKNIIIGVKLSGEKFPWKAFKNKHIFLSPVFSERVFREEKSDNYSINFIGKYIDFKNVNLFCEIAEEALKKFSNISINFYGDNSNINLNVKNLLARFPSRVQEHGYIQHQDLLKKIGSEKSIVLQTAAEYGGTIGAECVDMKVPLICGEFYGIDAISQKKYFLTCRLKKSEFVEDAIIHIANIIDNYELFSNEMEVYQKYYDKNLTIEKLKNII